ncbi:MAG: DUF4105 domain-containing protein [Bacteroidales bacterium]|jgi:hypothetical protein|nr:DUF4105 domain-containing protein [Bacteroidales bacterium]
MKTIKNICTYVVLFLLSVHLSFAQLSENAKVSILTCGDGFEFFESFGHTALRICDTALNMDYVFNWGVFDFNTDNFYLKFAQRRLPYMLGVTEYQWFVFEYAHDGRSMYEQELKLTFEEKNILYKAILVNYYPENRYYNYDFFQDNCATRIRDIVQNSLQGRQFPVNAVNNSNLTFRQLFYPYTEHFLWWRFGIDIALGMRADKKISTYNYMYLPKDLMFQFDTTILSHDNKTLTTSIQTVLEEQYPHSFPTVFSPKITFWLLCILVVVLTFMELKYRFYAKVFDVVFFSMIFILSLLVFYLCFISDHHATKDNFNLLWANPLILYALIRLRKSSIIVLSFLLGCLAVLVSGFWFLPQSFNIAFLPIWLILILRITLLILRKKQIIPSLSSQDDKQKKIK